MQEVPESNLPPSYQKHGAAMTDEELKITKRHWRGKRRAEALAQLVELDISPDKHTALMNAYKERDMFGPFWSTKGQDWYIEMFYSVQDGAQCVRRRRGYLEPFLDIDGTALDFVRYAVENLRGLEDMKFRFKSEPHLLTPSIAEYLQSKSAAVSTPPIDEGDDFPPAPWRRK